MTGAAAVRCASAPLEAVVADVPGSKSIANRALACAALATGVSTLQRVPTGDDTVAMIDCVEALGGRIERRPGAMLVVEGTSAHLTPGPLTLMTNLAGTTSRFITAICALGEGPYLVDGGPPLRARPMGPLHEALAALGAGVEPGGAVGHLPVTISGRSTRSGADRHTVGLRGDVSSQYVTALMLIAPYLPGGLEIELTTPLVSRPYVEMTAAVMAGFGGPRVDVGAAGISIGAGAYSGHVLAIEPDASSASYPLAAAAIVGGRVTVAGLGPSSLQGDARFAEVLGAMGCSVAGDGDGVTVTRHGPLRGVEVDMADISDTVPTLAAVAPFAGSPTRITGVGFIRRKESDRIGDLVRELNRVGVRAVEESDGLVVHPSTPHGGRVETHHDHRLAMSLALIGLRTPGLEVADPGVVAKSWPGYWDMLRALAAPRG